MKVTRNWLGTAGTAAILAMTSGAVGADTLDLNPLIGTSGDGLIFSDPAEGVLPSTRSRISATRT